MSLPIIQVGDPVLRQTARELSPAEIRSEPIQKLIEQMQETMRAAPGVGLAAPQIGKPLQIAVIEDREEYMRNWAAAELAERGRKPVPYQVLINPKITAQSEPIEFYEGCLSVAGFVALIPRDSHVKVECLNENAEPVSIEASGWYARILQHEIDHLKGILCIDHARPNTLMTVENYFKHGSK